MSHSSPVKISRAVSTIFIFKVKKLLLREVGWLIIVQRTVNGRALSTMQRFLLHQAEQTSPWPTSFFCGIWRTGRQCEGMERTLGPLSSHVASGSTHQLAGWQDANSFYGTFRLSFNHLEREVKWPRKSSLAWTSLGFGGAKRKKWLLDGVGQLIAGYPPISSLPLFLKINLVLGWF